MWDKSDPKGGRLSVSIGVAVLVAGWGLFVLSGLQSGLSSGAPAGGQPSLWESDLGGELSVLAGDDDEAESVTAAFAFPYAGGSYSTFFVGDNGVVALGGLGEAEDFPAGDEFIESDAPVIAPFWSDLSLVSRGAAYANDLGDRIVFTWTEVGSNRDEEASFSFQLQLHANGQIVFGYDGIAGLGADEIDETVHVGLAPGGLASFPTEVDYSQDTPFATAGDTLLERFAVGSAFDLDGENLVFTPQAGGGYRVAIPEPSAIALGLAALVVVVLIRRRGSSRRAAPCEV